MLVYKKALSVPGARCCYSASWQTVVKGELLFTSLFIPKKEIKESAGGLHLTQELVEACAGPAD